MTTAGDIYRYIDAFAPFSSAMDFDNPGLLVGGPQTPVTAAVVALDITPEVVEEAAGLGAELIISHHPVIFHPLKRLEAESAPYLLASRGIAAICAHTNYDMAPGGVNDCLAAALGLRSVRPLALYKQTPWYQVTVFAPKDYGDAVRQAMASAGAGRLGAYDGFSFTAEGIGRFTPDSAAQPFLGASGKEAVVAEERIEALCAPASLQAVLSAMRQAHPYEEPAFSVTRNHAVHTDFPEALIGELETPLSPRAFAGHVKRALGCEGVSAAYGGEEVRSVALCGGAGGDSLSAALKRADAYVTGEVRHHEWLLAAQMGKTLVCAGHFKTEDVAMEPLRRRLSERFPEVRFVKSASCADPVHFI